ncbi:MAG: hypothetical protein KGI25_03710 [Thaumarchaeota archaeon]|nr:hypothetical protein [Nitrososphaerota archaeon]
MSQEFEEIVCADPTCGVIRQIPKGLEMNARTYEDFFRCPHEKRPANNISRFHVCGRCHRTYGWIIPKRGMVFHCERCAPSKVETRTSFSKETLAALTPVKTELSPAELQQLWQEKGIV